MGYTNRLIDSIIHHPKRLLAVILPLTLFFAYFYFQQSQNNHISIFFDHNDPLYKVYQTFQETYGNEEFAVIALQSDDLFSGQTINVVRNLTDTLEGIDGVERVVSLANIEEFVGNDDEIMLRRIVAPGPLSENTLKEIRGRAESNRFVRENFISKDGLMTALHIELESMSEKEKRDTVNEIIRTANRITPKQYPVFCSGSSLMEVELNRLSEVDFNVFVPLILVIIFIFIFLLFRQMTLAMICQANLFVILIWGIGFFIMCGEQFNIITSAMGAILLAIAIADSVHILSHLKETSLNRELEPIPAIRKTLKDVWLPCMFTSLTTGAGFVSFYASDIRPVAMLGIFTAVNVLIAFLLSVTSLPAIMILLQKWVRASFLRYQDKHPRKLLDDRDAFKELLVRIGQFTTRHTILIFLLFIGVTAISFVGALKIKLETNTFHYIHDSNRIKADFKVIEDHFGGTIPFIVLIKSKTGTDFSDPATVKLVNTIQNHLLKTNRQLTNAFSVADYVKEFNRAINSNNSKFYTVPDSRLDIADAYELGDPEVLDRIISPDHREVCLTFHSVWDSNESGYRLNARTTDYLSKIIGSSYEFHITGLSSLYLAMDKHLQETQIRSFTIAFIIIFFMMIFLCRSVGLALISMVPNLFPIVLTLGLMGWFGIPLDVATTMIASVTIGIAVDDTIHFVTWLRKNSGIKPDVRTAIVQTFADVGKPIVITTLLLFTGFMVLVFGNIRPTQMFGLLTAFSMVFALIGDIYILPALILIFKPKLPPLSGHERLIDRTFCERPAGRSNTG